MEVKSLMDQIEVLSVPGSPKPPRRDDEDDEKLLEVNDFCFPFFSFSVAFGHVFFSRGQFLTTL